MYIYFIENNKNGRIYIGSTTNFERRKSEHMTEINRRFHSNKRLCDDLKSYSPNDFKMYIVSDLTGIKTLWLRAIEEMWISYLYSSFDIYNINHNTTSFKHRVSMPRAERILMRKICKPEKMKAAKLLNERIEKLTKSFISNDVESPF